MFGPNAMKWHDQLCFFLQPAIRMGAPSHDDAWTRGHTKARGQSYTQNCIGFHVSATTRLRCQFATSSLRHKMYCKLLHVGVSACAPLILCRSFYDPPWLLWCQWSWILSHRNIEWHLGLTSVVSAAKSEHADNPTMYERSWKKHRYIQLHPISREPWEPTSGSYAESLCRANLTLRPTICLNLDVEIRKRNCLGCQWVWLCLRVRRIDWINPRSSRTTLG